MEFAVKVKEPDDPWVSRIKQRKAAAKDKLNGMRTVRKKKGDAATKVQALARGMSVRRAAKRLDWRETNTPLYGSDIEEKCQRAAEEETAPQLDGAGIGDGLQIWRIEQHRAEPWPESRHGHFHTGDAFLVLHTQVEHDDRSPDAALKPGRRTWNVHIWIGRKSSQDEYGTAAVKAHELDERLLSIRGCSGQVIQHREVESAESNLFCGYFPRGLRYLQGGAGVGARLEGAGGEGSDAAEVAREPVLLRVKGTPGHVSLRQVGLKRSQMNSGDTFILDTAEVVRLQP